MRPFAATRIRDLVSVEGPDAATFLQGQLSQDVAGLALGDAVWSLLLQPTGKVDAWLRVNRAGPESFTLDVDAGFGEGVAARLNRFKLRTKAEISVTPGFDTEEDADEEQRIRQGVPAMGHEITPETIPGELGQWLIDASVSFTKGCYTGQELVARIDSRGGNVPRPLRGVKLGGPAAVGDEVLDAGGKVVGHLTSVAGGVALAPIMRRVEVPSAVTVAGHPGEVCGFPIA